MRVRSARNNIIGSKTTPIVKTQKIIADNNKPNIMV